MQHCDHQNVRKGNLVLAPFFSVETGNAYYRAKVLHISNLVDSSAQPKSRNRNAQVYFIDFGKTLIEELIDSIHSLRDTFLLLGHLDT